MTSVSAAGCSPPCNDALGEFAEIARGAVEEDVQTPSTAGTAAADDLGGQPL